MTISEHTPSNTTVRCIGSLTTIANILRLSTPDGDIAAPVEVHANE
ncbi:hypothetical protein [Haladaptatus halobius]|nr:hypothetical protein [Haladaptatus halobius]